jgi:HlyD family secretion protein
MPIIIDDQLKKEAERIQLRSEEVQAILGAIPHWIIRWGITVFFLVIVVFLIGSYLFTYPDIKQAMIQVTSANPPAEIAARAFGKIKQILVKDNQKVCKGQIMAIIENPANYEDVCDLKQKLADFFAKTDFSSQIQLKFSHFNPHYRLGDIQSAYENFLKIVGNYRHFILLQYNSKKITAISKQIQSYHLYQSRLETQFEIQKNELVLAQNQINRSKQLLEQGIISKNEFENQQSLYYQKEINFEAAKNSIENTIITIQQLEQTKQELQLIERTEENDKRLELKQAYDNLYSQIIQWEQTYVIQSPMDGIVTFTAFWSINQNVKTGDIVMTVVPDQPSTIIGKVTLPIQGSGKVKAGQTVNIKFDNYPYMEYGMVTGIVQTKSLVPFEKAYILEVTFPKGLTTNYGKQLYFQQGMIGSAEIITENERILSRILQPFRALFKKHLPDS